MKRILVIDDRSEVRDLIAEALAGRGWQTMTAQDGEEGWNLAFSELPDLILCDVEMPQMNGYQVLEKIRENGPTSTVPFIFMTGLVDRPQVRQGMSLGADDYLAKPFTVSELVSAVETRLKKHEAFNRAADKKIDQFRGSISLALPHELRTPLNGILGFASILSQTPAVSPEEVKEFAQHIYSSALRLERLIENCLLYSQLELAGMNPDSARKLRSRELFAARDLINATSIMKASEHNRTKDLTLELDDINLLINPAHLEKIVAELLDNACKFSSVGAAIHISAREAAGLVQIEITDHGQGMTTEQTRNIGAHIQFDRLTKEQQGSGLGLILAKKLVELHGGNFWVQSVPRTRTCVFMEFSCAPEDQD